MFLQSEWPPGLQNASVATILGWWFQGVSLGSVWSLWLVVLVNMGDLAPAGPSNLQFDKTIVFLRSEWPVGLQNTSVVIILGAQHGRRSHN